MRLLDMFGESRKTCVKCSERWRQRLNNHEAFLERERNRDKEITKLYRNNYCEKIKGEFVTCSVCRYDIKIY